MDNMEKVKSAVTVFLKKTLNVRDLQVIKVAKIENGWEAEAEVYEESSFIKALGLSTKVRDRNIYELKLSDDLEVQSYGRKNEKID